MIIESAEQKAVLVPSPKPAQEGSWISSLCISLHSGSQIINIDSVQILVQIFFGTDCQSQYVILKLTWSFLENF